MEENSCTLTSAHKVTKNVKIFRLLQFSSCKSLKDKKSPIGRIEGGITARWESETKIGFYQTS